MRNKTWIRSFESSETGVKLDWTKTGRIPLGNVVVEAEEEGRDIGLIGTSAAEDDAAELAELMDDIEGRIENGFCSGALESEIDEIRVEFIDPQLQRQLKNPRDLQLQLFW